MARIESIFQRETKKAEQHPKRITKWIHYTKLHENKDQYCDAPNKEAIEALADLIEADGEVLQDLLVRKIDTDEYEIVAGHKRRKACQLLVEERGKQEFSFLPCYIKNESDVRSEFRLYSTNGYHEKTEYEKMHELERMKYLLENFPEEFPQIQTGRMVERLAKLLNMKKTTVGEYLTIAKNLGDKGMEKFRSGEIKKSAAVELSGMPEEDQNQLIDHGITTHAEIKKIKHEKNSESVEKSPTNDGTKKRGNLPDSLISEQGCRCEETQQQPELPVLKNDDQRKEFLNNYQRWPVWFEVPEAAETYYRYDLPDGDSIVVCEYHQYIPHLKNPEQTYERMYLLEQGYHYLADCKTNMTSLIERLKYKYRKGNG